jgi:hypothetical protein
MSKQSEARDEHAGRNVLRIVYDNERGDVYVETWGNHDGVSVHTSVRLTRARFVALVKDVSVL